ncbi:hypothetical protein [Bradyrhizobium vignae]|uniref:Uncharacterized protein n=1 Tax=Bradyrhizobium vignae TaxID=1549949 RepID=A0ABS4A1U0_9BRAD|nr:hypothetical protein [Bradyrhizobium vignae]MBP0114370.1 hypothetical protein [Bradyrhizobium vignae]
MQTEFRKLNDEGMARFTEWLTAGAGGIPPVHLLADPETSASIGHTIHPASSRIFTNRYEFGQYLIQLLSPFDPAAIPQDRGLWTALAIVWFDQLCPAGANGQRKVEKEYRYILSRDYRHYYRHLVRSPWQLVRDHGEASKLLLLAPTDGEHPLRRHGEILEQLGGRQFVLGSRPIIAEASRLYTDAATGRPLKGVSGSGRGSVRRLALVLRQFDLTFDPETMSPGQLLGLLPKEFDRWTAAARAAA